MKIVDKPWGYEKIWAEEKEYRAKILYIKGGHSLSLQYHNKKDESIYVLSGIVKFEYKHVVGSAPLKVAILEPGDVRNIMSHIVHRISAVDYDAQVMEVSNGVSDDDILFVLTMRMADKICDKNSSL